MANRTVSLHRKVKTESGWRRYPAVFAANGKIKPDHVIIGGEEVRIPGGHFELRSFAGTKTVWTRIQGGPAEALAALKTTQAKASIRAEAERVGVAVVADDNRIDLAKAKAKFVHAALNRGSGESAEVYGRSIDAFLLVTGKTYADQLDDGDMVKFHTAMRKQGLSARTIANRHGHIRSFMKFVKVPADKVKELAGPKPRYEKTLPEVYTPDELDTFFAHLESVESDYDRLLFDVLLTCGLREQEVMHLEWKDVNAEASKLTLRANPKWGFKLKDYEEREVPLKADLLKSLQKYRQAHPGTQLVFGAKGGELDAPDGHLLRRLKRLVRAAELNCKVCDGCNKRNECERWWLHKFRATYITTLLRNGVDLRSVMALSGHSDLDSVMRYLRPAESETIQEKVNSIKFR